MWMDESELEATNRFVWMQILLCGLICPDSNSGLDGAVMRPFVFWLHELRIAAFTC